MAYGIQVNNGSGLEIFGVNTTSSNFVAVNSVTVNAGTTSSAIAAEGMTANNTGEVLLMIVARGSEYATTNFLSFTRGNGSFTISNSSSVLNFTVNYRVIRI